jgi:hypothetical protein
LFFWSEFAILLRNTPKCSGLYFDKYIISCRGRPKLNWPEGIRGLIGEKGLMEEDWNDRSNWRKKNI